MPSSLALDSEWLSAWVQPRHLDAAAIEAHRRALDEHPARLLVVNSFLVAERAAAVAEFLGREAQFFRRVGLYSKPGGVPAAEYRSAPGEDRFYQMGILSGVRPEFRMGRNVWTYLRFFRALGDDRFVTLFTAMTGLPLGRAHLTVHSMTDGDFVLPHTDSVFDRQIAFIFYLTPEWRAEYGGALRLFTKDGREWIVEPAYNSLVIFDVNAGTEHEVCSVTPAAGTLGRATISGWIDTSKSQE